jgi:trimethyllysine dioxygenase
MNEKLELRKKAIASLKEAIQKPFSELQDRSSEAQSPPRGTQDPAKEVRRPLSEVHWALADGYEVGRHLEHGKGPLNRHDERGLPTWGDWGVCVKLTGWSGSTTLTLSVFFFCMSLQ